MGVRPWLVMAVAAIACFPLADGYVAAAVPPADAPAIYNGSVGTLALRATLDVASLRDQGCPPDLAVSATTECAARTGDGVARGLGSIRYAYAFPVEIATAPCDRLSLRVLAYRVRMLVGGKGEIHLALPESRCVVAEPADLREHVRSISQEFTITGGTGAYAGASGSGTVTRAIAPTGSGGAGTETWTGTLDVPGVEFDLTPPALTGARAKTVRAPRRAALVRVRYAVTATDAVDGRVPVVCQPRSGSWFRVGRTVVRCSATDTSANQAGARFTVTVRRR